MSEADFRELLDEQRADIQTIGEYVRKLKEHNVFMGQINAEDEGEMKANIMLAYRHLEDARMRLGKVIQAYEGGESIYDKK